MVGAEIVEAVSPKWDATATKSKISTEPSLFTSPDNPASVCPNSDATVTKSKMSTVPFPLTSQGKTSTYEKLVSTLCPSGLITISVTSPTMLDLGTVTVTFSFSMTGSIPASSPNWIVAWLSKFSPVIVMISPPAISAAKGVTVKIVGGNWMYVNAWDNVSDRPSLLVTVRSIGPTTPTGVRAVISFSLLIVVATATFSPIINEAPSRKLAPVILIGVLPLVTPLAGAISLIFGLG